MKAGNSMPEDFPFAQRTSWEMMQNEITSQLDGLHHSGTSIIDLTESNPTRCGFLYPEEKILKPLSLPSGMIYDPSPHGNHEAREAVARYYRSKNISISPDQVFLCASTSEAYTFLFRLLADPKERILFPRPSYPLFEFLVGLNDIRMDTYALGYDRGTQRDEDEWYIDLKNLEAEIQSNTKAIVLVNPNNPTGSYVKADELKALNKICTQNNLAIISDEVFYDYEFVHRTDKVSLAENKKVLTFTMGGLSKTLCLPQMKLSWIVVNGPEAQVKAATERMEIILDTYLSVNTPVQNALKDWLDLQPQIHSEVLGRVQRNRDFLIQHVKGVDNCECLNAEGGWYAIIRMPETKSEEEWGLELLNKDHVFVHPGYFFDFWEEPFIVVSLLPKPEQFREGVTRILKRVAGS